MSRRRLLPVAAVCALLAALAASTGSASAARVLVLERGGHVRAVDNPFLNGTPVAPPARPLFAAAAKTSRKKAPAVTVPSVLRAKLNRHQITAAAYRSYLGEWNSALREEKHLSAARAQQLASVTEMVHGLAVSGQLWPSRLPAVFLTLERNAQWWRSGSMLSYGQRVQFAGSQLEWEYYTGEGIQLQVLGTFGEANGFYEAGRADYGKLTSLLAEMIPLAVTRAGGLAWEYYFDWEGGKPPWVSAMAQATGIEALTNAYRATGNKQYLQDAHAALPLLQTPPPVGVGVRTARGLRFLQYSFSSVDIINAFLQTLIGLDDYATASDDPVAQSLLQRGTAQAKAELPSFNTGAWSLYQPGQEDDLSYHQLVTGFLQTLCSQTKTPIYCSTAAAFQADLKTPPALRQLTTTARAGHSFPLRFTLSKISRVGVVLTGSGGKDYLYTSAQFSHGNDYFTAPALKRGTYTVKLSATDLAGNHNAISGTVRVS